MHRQLAWRRVGYVIRRPRPTQAALRWFPASGRSLPSSARSAAQHEPGTAKRESTRSTRMAGAVVLGVALVLMLIPPAPAIAATHPHAVGGTQRASTGGTKPRTGTEFHVSYEIRLDRVINPAHPKTSTTAPPVGERYVAVEFTAGPANATTGTYIGGASLFARLVGSNHKSYKATLLTTTVRGCRSFTGQSMGTRRVATGCVVFALPNPVRPVKVEWRFWGWNSGAGRRGPTYWWSA